MRKIILVIPLIFLTFSLVSCGVPTAPAPAPAPAPTPAPPPPPTPPNAPSNLTSSDVKHTTITLEWNDNSNDEHGFKIYRDNNIVATVSTNVITYQDTSLKPATSYQYSVKAYNQAGESAASLCTIRTPNPPITVRLDRIGVYDNRETWTRGEDGEVYVGIIVTDGNTIVEERFPEGEGQHYKLEKNETVDIGTIVFSVDEVGDYIRIAAVGYEDDGGQGEMLLCQALGAAGAAYISGGAATLLEMTDSSLGNLLAKIFGAEDDWLGSYERNWNYDDNWGIGNYQDIALEDERGIPCLRLWFTITSR